MNLSKLENKVYLELKRNKLDVFRIKDIVILFKVNKTKAYNIIKSLKKKRAIWKAGKGFFALHDADEFLIALSINYPSYISFWTALNYYGLSDNTPKKIFLATTKYSKEIGNFKFVKLSKAKFFGYIKIGNLTIAEKEKAIVDSLLFPKYAGGIKEITKCIEAGKKTLDIKKLIFFAEKAGSIAVLRRLGFILETLGIKGYQKIKDIGRGYELLDPSLKRKNNLNKRWLLDVNI